jgi:hypothetical protein
MLAGLFLQAFAKIGISEADDRPRPLGDRLAQGRQQIQQLAEGRSLQFSTTKHN